MDDHSRRILYGDLWEQETSWAHITAAQYVATHFGLALSYYVDNHSIFRFVERRDSMHRKATATEETAVVQWKEVMQQLGIEVIYALSPSAKGKIERPYRWLQDHLVRTCLHERITTIDEARKVLYEEIHHYNHQRVHSVTQEIPAIRFERAIEEKRSVFQWFSINPPSQKLEDLFCYRFKRVVDSYRNISFNNFKLPISGAPIQATVELRISFNLPAQMALVRVWYHSTCIGEHKLKISDLKKIHF